MTTFEFSLTCLQLLLLFFFVFNCEHRLSQGSRRLFLYPLFLDLRENFFLLLFPSSWEYSLLKPVKIFFLFFCSDLERKADILMGHLYVSFTNMQIVIVVLCQHSSSNVLRQFQGILDFLVRVALQLELIMILEPQDLDSEPVL